MGLLPPTFFDDDFVLQCKMEMDASMFQCWFEDINGGDVLLGYIETDIEQGSLAYKGKFYLIVSLLYVENTKDNTILVGAPTMVDFKLTTKELREVLLTGFVSREVMNK